jgi:uncharacterized protein YjbI with pentapeptide repeats
MSLETTSKVFNALYPEELLERYNAGERNFAKINLLRRELESILGETVDTALIEPGYKRLENFNELWSDFYNPVPSFLPGSRRFEWDSYGRFIPKELDDLVSERDLSNVNLSNIALKGSYLYPINFSKTNLSRADLRNVILLDVNLQGANLSHADLRDAVIRGNLSDVTLDMARLERCSLGWCDLQGANLKRAKLQKADLTGANLRQADLSKAHFKDTVLNGTNLLGVDFKDVTLTNVYVTGVTLAASQESDFIKSLQIHLLDS